VHIKVYASSIMPVSVTSRQTQKQTHREPSTLFPLKQFTKKTSLYWTYKCSEWVSL